MGRAHDQPDSRAAVALFAMNCLPLQLPDGFCHPTPPHSEPVQAEGSNAHARIATAEEGSDRCEYNRCGVSRCVCVVFAAVCAEHVMYVCGGVWDDSSITRSFCGVGARRCCRVPAKQARPYVRPRVIG
mmetsp:Transcript_35410/g.103754  ORF Transcript_35410/g.103754 Transcript_35410/m.103754 type:complete len:129 (-) Transcript_35410:29-415(-)